MASLCSPIMLSQTSAPFDGVVALSGSNLAFIKYQDIVYDQGHGNVEYL